jgi:dihydrofolate reductase
MSRPFDLVLGRRISEIFAAYWPHVADADAEPLNTATKHVASTTLTELDWRNSQLIEGDVAEGVRGLKEQDGSELQVHGSANLIQTLLGHGLVDEFRLKIYPVVLGCGKRLFDGGAVPAGLGLLRELMTSLSRDVATCDEREPRLGGVHVDRELVRPVVRQGRGDIRAALAFDHVAQRRRDRRELRVEVLQRPVFLAGAGMEVSGAAGSTAFQPEPDREALVAALQRHGSRAARPVLLGELEGHGLVRPRRRRGDARRRALSIIPPARREH